MLKIFKNTLLAKAFVRINIFKAILSYNKTEDVDTHKTLR